MAYIGISPGLSGAIVAITDDGIEFHDMPTMVIDKQKIIDYIGIWEILNRYPSRKCMVEIEHNDEATLGQPSGMALALGLLTFQVPHQLITAPIWQRCYRLVDCSHEALREKALELFPRYAQDLNRKKHGGRAKALLIACYLKFRDKVKACRGDEM
jgi:hypothetical protein